MKFYAVLSRILVACVTPLCSAQTAYTVRTIDVPQSLATNILGINDRGQITGDWYTNVAPVVGTAFMADADGNNLVMLPQLGLIATFAAGINNTAEIAGGSETYSGNGGKILHGFLTPDLGKTIVPVDVPGAGTPLIGGTHPAALNDSNVVAGYWSSTANYPYHGFTRSADGEYTSFDLPGENFVGTIPGILITGGINNAGTVSGYFQNVSLMVRGFSRSSEGNTATFAVPSVDPPSSGTFATGINNAGDITGYTQGAGEQHPQPSRGFVRSFDGLNYFYFDLPGLPSIVPQIQGLNTQRQLVGRYSTPDGIGHGFVATPNPADPHPIFSVSKAFSGPPGQLTLTLTDEGSGLQSVTVLSHSSADVSIPAFTPGAKSVDITITKAADTDPFDAVLSAKDIGNNETVMEASAPFIEVSQNIPGPPASTVYGVSAMAGLVAITTTPANTSVKVDPFTPGQTGVVHVTTSKIDPSRGASLTIRATDRMDNETTFAVPGDGTISVSATSFHFAPHNAGETGGPGIVYVQNTMVDPVVLRVTLSSPYFAVSGTTCGETLASGTSCQVQFTFTPPGPGDFTASLSIGQGLYVALSGSGLGSGLSVSPATFSFAGHPVGETSGPGKIFLHNYGSNPLTIQSATLGGDAAGDFKIVSTTCAATLPAYQTCSYTLTATPSATGTRNATLTVASNYAGSPQTAALQTYGR